MSGVWFLSMCCVFWPNFSPNVVNLLFLRVFFTVSCYLKKGSFTVTKVFWLSKCFWFGFKHCGKTSWSALWDKFTLRCYYRFCFHQDFKRNQKFLLMSQVTCVADGFVGWGGGGRVREHQNRKENGAGTTRNVFVSPLICTRFARSHRSFARSRPDRSARYAGCASIEIGPHSLRSL